MKTSNVGKGSYQTRIFTHSSSLTATSGAFPSQLFDRGPVTWMAPPHFARKTLSNDPCALFHSLISPRCRHSRPAPLSCARRRQEEVSWMATHDCFDSEVVTVTTTLVEAPDPRDDRTLLIGFCLTRPLQRLRTKTALQINTGLPREAARRQGYKNNRLQ